MSDNDSTITIDYHIRFDNGQEQSFSVKLHSETLDILPQQRIEPREWTKLEFNKCSNCTLDPAAHPDCPVALNLADLIEFFSKVLSYEEVEVTIETGLRNYFKRVPLQNVASSLMGIYMVTSGCPILNKMRPMVQTHLPFQTWEETTYRMISMYLMAQYFLNKTGKKPDWQLKGLLKFFNDVYQVNSAFFKRMVEIKFKDGDAGLNAVTILNASVNLTSLSIEDDDLAHWQNLFLNHWDEE